MQLSTSFFNPNMSLKELGLKPDICNSNNTKWWFQISYYSILS